MVRLVWLFMLGRRIPSVKRLLGCVRKLIEDLPELTVILIKLLQELHNSPKIKLNRTIYPFPATSGNRTLNHQDAEYQKIKPRTAFAGVCWRHLDEKTSIAARRPGSPDLQRTNISTKLQNPIAKFSPYVQKKNFEASRGA